MQIVGRAAKRSVPGARLAAMRISATALLATLLILVVPGCGSDPAADRAQAYVEGVDAARAALVSDLEQLAADAPPTSTPKTEAQLLLRYEKAVGRAQTRVRALKPPEKVRAEHTELLSALRSYEVALGKARASGAKAPASSIPAIREALAEQLEQASAEVDRHIAAIARLLGSE